MNRVSAMKRTSVTEGLIGIYSLGWKRTPVQRRGYTRRGTKNELTSGDIEGGDEVLNICNNRWWSNTPTMAVENIVVMVVGDVCATVGTPFDA